MKVEMAAKVVSASLVSGMVWIEKKPFPVSLFLSIWIEKEREERKERS